MPQGRPESVDSLIAGILLRSEADLPVSGEPAEVLTFLLADIRGYTAFTQQRGDEAAGKLTAKFATVIREVIGLHGGTVFETSGDEALCVFHSARQSLRAAVALQQRFVTETSADDRLPLTVGIGIDAGEAVRGPDGYRGGALNLAARLCGHAKAGEVLASPAVTHLARAIEGIRYVPHDRVTMKGLADPMRPVRVLPDSEDPVRQFAALMAARRSAPGRRVRWLPGALGKHPRRTAAGAAAVALALVGATVVASQGDGPSTPSLRAVAENSVGMIDSGSGRIVGQVAVEAGPAAVVFAYGSLWTANKDADSVSRIDPATRTVLRVIDVGTAPSAITFGFDSIWVTNSGDGTVSRIDRRTNRSVGDAIAVGVTPGGIAVTTEAVWVANSGAGSVSRIDPARNAAATPVAVGNGPSAIAADGHDVWVLDSGDNDVARIDGATLRVTRVRVGSAPENLAVADGVVWVTNTISGTVARIEHSARKDAEIFRIGEEPGAIAVARGKIWIAYPGRGVLTETDPATRRVITTISLHVTPSALAAADGTVWVTTTLERGAAHRGGTLRVRGDPIDSLDPTYVNSADDGTVDANLYDGLLGFRRASGGGGTTIVPDLADGIPEPSNDGRTYVFRLRSNIRWSTGRLLTASDVRRGIARAIVSQLYPTLPIVVGGTRCDRVRCTLPGVVADDAAGTVTVTLARPSSNILDVLALVKAVPPDTPPTAQPRRVFPTTGPYRVADYVPSARVVLVRNQHFHEWSAAAQPAGFPTSLEWLTDTDNAHRVAQVHAGSADLTDARFAGPVAATQAQFGARAHIVPTESLHGLMLNTRLRPFDDVRVRQALALAIDRAAIADDWPGGGELTCQFLPPNYPGYRPYCPFSVHSAVEDGRWHGQDLLAAQRLVAASGTRGMSITIRIPPADRAAMHRVVDALATLGYHARLVVDARDSLAYFSYISDSRHPVQAAFFGWVTSDASAENLLGLWTCAAYTPANPGNLNPAHFCDPAIDRLIDKASRIPSSSPAQSSAAWAEVDRQLVLAQPWIPLVHPLWVDVVSARVHHYVRNPVYGVLLDQVWLR